MNWVDLVAAGPALVVVVVTIAVTAVEIREGRAGVGEREHVEWNNLTMRDCRVAEIRKAYLDGRLNVFEFLAKLDVAFASPACPPDSEIVASWNVAVDGMPRGGVIRVVNTRGGGMIIHEVPEDPWS